MKKTRPKEIVKFRCDPALRRALKLRAALLDTDLQTVILETLRNGFAVELDEVERRGLVENDLRDEGKKAPKKRKGKDTQALTCPPTGCSKMWILDFALG